MQMITSITCMMITLGLLLATFGGGAAAPPPEDEDKDRMTVEGKITDVMEIYPPRLNVKAKAGSYKVQLLEEAKVTWRGKQVDFGKLRPEQQIRAKGKRPANTKGIDLNALEIEILEAESKL